MLVRLGPLVIDLRKISAVYDEIEVRSRNGNIQQCLVIILDSGITLPLNDIEAKKAFREKYYNFLNIPEDLLNIQNNAKMQIIKPQSNINQALPKLNLDRIRNPYKGD